MLRSLVLFLAVMAVGSGVPAGEKNEEIGDRIENSRPYVAVVADPSLGPGAAHGLSKILAALDAKGIAVRRAASPSLAPATSRTLVVGLATGSGSAAQMIRAAGIAAPTAPEALLVHHATFDGKPLLLVAGSDDRGLMYAELDVADRIAWSTDPGDPLSEVRDAMEKPFMPERGLSIYTMHRATFESFFYDEQYWAEYLDMLARDRFNTFVLIFGYENWGYFAPPYPFFFDVEGYDGVRAVGITRQQQERNLKALNRVIEMAHQRGLNFTLGIWDHIYRGGVQGPTEFTKQPTEGVVWGLTADNLMPYTKAALKKFLHEVPHLDAIQFRMHNESGLKSGQEMEDFWTDVYRLMKDSGGKIRFEARAKEFPDNLIDRALEVGVDLRISTKYWMEQMGLPFHPTHVHPANQHDRRHGYADMLRYPKRYEMHWQLWNGGTSRVLLWGDPEYVRRFARSTLIYPGGGYEVNAPMATKMQDQPHDMPPFELLTPEYRFYRWEFERYWHFFQVFGRLGYDPDTPPEVWRREFERRFGPAAAPLVEQAVHRASQILPFAVAYTYPYSHFPTTRGWVERQRQEDLPEYAKALPSDTEQFLSIDDAARNMLEGVDSAKFLPQESAAWFDRAARDVLELVERAEQCVGEHRSKEFVATMVDMRILANLALYHSQRCRAGLSYALFTHSHDLGALDDAIRHEGRAAEAWAKIVEAAGDVYSDDIMMGRRSSDLSGHWRDELVKLNAGLDKLRRQRQGFQPQLSADGPTIAHVPIRRMPPGREMTIRATIAGKKPIAQARAGLTLPGRETIYVAMQPVAPLLYRATIPAPQVAAGLGYFIEATDDAGRRVAFPATGVQGPIHVAVTLDRDPPEVVHSPIASAPVGKPLTIAATVRDPSGVKWVRLRYRSVTQYEDYRTLEMRPTGEQDRYEATVPGEQIVPQWDFMYFIETVDQQGNGTIYPDFQKEMPYVVVALQR